MKTKIIIPALALTLLSGSILTASDAEARGCPYSGGGHGGNYMHDTNITDEQREAARALVTASQKKTAPIKEQLFVKNQELEALQNAATPDVEAVKKVANEVVELRKQLRTERDNLGLEIDKALGLPAGTHALNGYGHGNGNGHGKNKGHGKGHGMKNQY